MARDRRNCECCGSKFGVIVESRGSRVRRFQTQGTRTGGGAAFFSKWIEEPRPSHRQNIGSHRMMHEFSKRMTSHWSPRKRMTCMILCRRHHRVRTPEVPTSPSIRLTSMRSTDRSWRDRGDRAIGFVGHHVLSRKGPQTTGKAFYSGFYRTKTRQNMTKRCLRPLKAVGPSIHLNTSTLKAMGAPRAMGGCPTSTWHHLSKHQFLMWQS